MAQPTWIDEEERSRLAALTAMNVLRRYDNSVLKILCSASHVIVYELERTPDGESRWKHTDINGVLHVIERNSDPQYRLLVMNRKGIDNLVEDLIPTKVELEFSENLIMYKNVGGKVRGIWFYESSEYVAASDVVTSIVSEPGVRQMAGGTQSMERATSSEPQPSARESQPLIPTYELGSRTADHEEQQGIERFFPGLAAEDLHDTVQPSRIVENGEGRSESVIAGSLSGNPTSFDPGVVTFATADANEEPVGGPDGNMLLNMLQGNTTLEATTRPITESIPPAGDQMPPVGKTLEPYQWDTQDSAIISQSNVPLAHPPVEGRAREEDELLSMLGKASLMENGGNLGKEAIRSYLRRLVDDSSYFDMFYNAYVQQEGTI